MNSLSSWQEFLTIFFSFVMILGFFSVLRVFRSK